MNVSYFITGATGVVGSALIPLLLQTNKKCVVWALIRAESEGHLEKRFRELIGFWELGESETNDVFERVVPVRGDMSEPRFGIKPDLYKEIVEECSHIIHCAGVVRMNLPLEQARGYALEAAKNVVAMALDCGKHRKLKKIEYVSTVGVGGRMPGVVPETWVPETWVAENYGYHNTYEQSKAEAESYLQKQLEKRDLPLTVHRPSMVVGDSKIGKIIHFQIFYHLCQFLSGRRTMGLAPILGDAKLDTVPVDYVARIIKWSSESNALSGKILHICSGPKDSITLSSLRALVRKRFGEFGIRLPPIVPLPAVVFYRLVQIFLPCVNQKHRRAIKTLPIFLEYLSDKQGFSNEQTTLESRKLGGPERPMHNRYLGKSIDYYLRNQESG